MERGSWVAARVPRCAPARSRWIPCRRMDCGPPLPPLRCFTPRRIAPSAQLCIRCVQTLPKPGATASPRCEAGPPPAPSAVSSAFRQTENARSGEFSRSRRDAQQGPRCYCISLGTTRILLRVCGGKHQAMSHGGGSRMDESGGCSPPVHQENAGGRRGRCIKSAPVRHMPCPTRCTARNGCAGVCGAGRAGKRKKEYAMYDTGRRRKAGAETAPRGAARRCGP